MDLYFLDKNRQLVGIIDTAESVQWRETYYEVGTFEIRCQLTTSIKEIIDNSYFVRRNDSERVGVIEYYDSLDSIEEGKFITIQGRFAECLLGYRIIRYRIDLTNTVGNLVSTLINQNAIDPVLQPDEIEEGLTVSRRKITCIENTIINNLIGDTTQISIQANYEDNLLEFILQLLQQINSSFKMTLNENNNFVITLFTGIDRSLNQDTNPHIVFSQQYDNLLSANYIMDKTEELNAIYIGGEEQLSRAEGRFMTKYETPSGSGKVSDLDRKEIFVDGDDIKQQFTDEWGKLLPALDDATYEQILINSAKENVVKATQQLDASINASMYTYGPASTSTDYYIGDIIVIQDDLFGTFNKRVIGMTYIDEETSTMEPILEE